MSSRLRILFHCSSDGSVAHVGRRALERMHQLGQESRPTVRSISKAEWLERGRPPILERKMGWSPDMKPVFFYDIAEPALPKFLTHAKDLGLTVQAAKSLWKRLPQELRKQCCLMVMRENRGNCWRRSQSNPRRYGWMASKPALKAAPTVAPDAPGAFAEVFPEYVTVTGGLASLAPDWTPDWSGTGSGHAAFNEVAVQVPEIFEDPEPGPLKSPAQTAKAGQSFAYKIAPSPFDKPFAKPSPPKKKKKFVPGTNIAIADEPSGVQAMQAKPKLKLGIWS